MRHLIFAIIFNSAFSCSSANSGCSSPESSVMGKIIDESIQIPSTDLCELNEQSIETITDKLISQPEEIIKSVDLDPNYEECLLEMTNKLFDVNSISESKLKAIAALASKSDGFLTEYLFESIASLFDSNLEELLNFILANPKSYMYQLVVDGLGMRIAFYGEDKDKLEADAIVSLNKESHIELVGQIFGDVNPDKFD
ncbi:hypothetical protein SAMN05421640_1196 [Ekhidna lutea]|uniref:Uncharacterized protein n=1 Tax=Ekhidna lutea TaxID=447679 RepID=A0A239HBU8_EKHLU|nr:hypothetical protein [Ekhidna lutea]SNS77734.1 hypothetical protein SAMN05421640_1196 [Ekhidna lutea]